MQSYVNAEITAGNVLPPIASAAQLGVIRVGANLTIDAGTGILDAVLPSGVEFQGEWTDALNPLFLLRTVSSGCGPVVLLQP